MIVPLTWSGTRGRRGVGGVSGNQAFFDPTLFTPYIEGLDPLAMLRVCTILFGFLSILADSLTATPADCGIEEHAVTTDKADCF